MAGKDEPKQINLMATKTPFQLEWLGGMSLVESTHGVNTQAIPYTCGGTPQHSTLHHQDLQAARCLVRWASQDIQLFSLHEAWRAPNP